jgi:hypothetical protein
VKKKFANTSLFRLKVQNGVKKARLRFFFAQDAMFPRNAHTENAFGRKTPTITENGN